MSLGKQLSEARRSLKLTTSEVAASTRVKVQIIEGLEQDDFSKIAAPIYGKGFIRLYAEHVRVDPAPLIAEYMQAVGAPESPPLDLGAEMSRPPKAQKPPSPIQKAEKQTEPPEADQTETEYDLFNEPEEKPVEKNAPDEARAEETPAATAGGEETIEEAREPESLKTEDEKAPRAGRLMVAVEGVKAVGAQLLEWIAMACTGALQKARAMKPDRDPWKLIPVAVGVVLIIAFVVSGLSRCARVPDSSNADVDPATRETLKVAVDLPEPYFE